MAQKWPKSDTLLARKSRTRARDMPDSLFALISVLTYGDSVKKQTITWLMLLAMAAVCLVLTGCGGHG